MIFIRHEEKIGRFMEINKLKGSLPDTVLFEIDLIIEEFEINTPLKLAHFLSQASHESGGFSAVKENLNYSAERLTVVFPKYFKTLAEALPYHRNAPKIANKVYANRMGNGSEISNDGFTYRGRGYIQLTGRSNYMLFDSSVPEDIISNPDLVATKYPLYSAAWFWHTNKLNSIADIGASDGNVTLITKKVNGGTHGLADRIQRFKTYYNLLS